MIKEPLGLIYYISIDWTLSPLAAYVKAATGTWKHFHRHLGARKWTLADPCSVSFELNM